MLSRESRKLAGILLVIFPSVIYGGVSLLSFILGRQPGYLDNPVRQDLFRAGHAHAGVLLILSLVALRYVDEARLSPSWKAAVRHGIPSAAIFLPVGFFFSVLTPSATEPNGVIYVAFAGAVILAVSLAALGVGLLRNRE
jgi:peptidoglycan/LPS O-acetylase OafA/YrhL